MKLAWLVLVIVLLSFGALWVFERMYEREAVTCTSKGGEFVYLPSGGSLCLKPGTVIHLAAPNLPTK